MVALFWPVVAWLLREVVVKFIVFAAVFALVDFLVPYVVGYIFPFIGVSNLNYAFDFVSPGVWFWLDFFNLAFGLPMIISAFVARFLIRRLPVIG